jgi:enterochelin esterase-like enzyme
MKPKRKPLPYASESHVLYSRYLKRYRTIDVYLPDLYQKKQSLRFALVLMNDGQDARALKVLSTVEHLHQSGMFEPFIVVGIPAQRRIQEYGTASSPDYKGRGGKAGLYRDFVVKEVLPFVKARYRVHRQADKTHFMGFSLGALSALDIVWAHPESFGSAGVFSGSLWWRRKAQKPFENEDQCRIIHEIIRNSSYKKGLRFWFEAGTLDETEDRNRNGIIDAIDDTLDLIKELVKIGYSSESEIHYLEVKGGRHNAQTWCRVIPNYLYWALKKDLSTVSPD